ncbi:putative RNA-directed DNA polymerase [Tanacetum coccineum]
MPTIITTKHRLYHQPYLPSPQTSDLWLLYSIVLYYLVAIQYLLDLDYFAVLLRVHCNTFHASNLGVGGFLVIVVWELYYHLVGKMVEIEDIDPKIGKPKKYKGQASNSKELKLSDYDPLFLHSSDSNEKLQKHDQLIRLMQFLMGMDDVFGSVINSILITDVKSAYATLSRDESHRVNNVHYVVNKTCSSSAFVSRSNNDWFKKNPKGNNPKANVNNVTTCGSGNSHMLTSDEYQKLMGLLKSSGSSIACDIGASQHMTYSAMFLFNVIDVSHLNITVRHPNGNNAKVNQVGSFTLTETLVIHDVLVVPGYHVSLLSIHKLANGNKLSVVFNEMDCLIQDSTQKSLMGTSSMIGGLYFLDQGKKHVNSNVKTCVMYKCLWHNRLGHPVDQVLHVLKDKIDIKDLDTSPCDVCHKAKQTREPFPISNHKTSILGQLVHLDVWGPYRVRSREGFKYFLTIVDEFSRVVWVFMLKGKDEVFSNIVMFYNLIKNQFGKTIKVFRSDNGTEFVNKQFNNFCVTNGITHQTSCAYTPQQNRIAERKHRHLLNVARALMFFIGGASEHVD